MFPRSWLAVTIDTSSTVIVATQHAKSNSAVAQPHWATAIAVMGEGYRDGIPVSRQAEILAKALYALNHFESGDCNRSPVQKHWQPKILSEEPPVKVKTDSGVWEAGWMIMVWGRGYAAVKHCEMGKIVWVPLLKIKPDVSKDLIRT